jgi:adenylate cyclase
MPDLVAQGPQLEDRWRRKLQPGVRQTIGREAGAWSTPWDDRISRQHVAIVYQDGQLQVETLGSARNPVFFRGHPCDRFTMPRGGHFVIGGTTFSLVDQDVSASLDFPRPTGERTFSAEELRRRPFREPDKRIDALSRLPDIIRGSSTDQELFVRLVNLLLSGIEHATAAAVVAVQPGDAAVEIFHCDHRMLSSTKFRPSERLIRQAVNSGESVAHVWTDHQARFQGEFTLNAEADWALCVPVPGEARRGWGLYVTGSFSGEIGPSGPHSAEMLRDDVKFTELTAATLGGLRQSRLLAARQASLNQFFSPIVAQAISSQEPEQALAPREADVTVLFCDLRGFTRESERSAGDLLGLLERVSQALGVMTHQILKHGGVVGDFHGDAAMGFWGWPLPQPDAVQRACQAALGIRVAFVDSSRRAGAEMSLGDFRVGIGIASGRAVAGKIGTVDQVKVTVFGPVVNLASRLETMTRRLGASILVDPSTAAIIRASVPSDDCRVRRLARVLPLGLSAPIDVSELLPPERDCSELTNERIASYDTALAAFEAGDWPRALQCLDAVGPDDSAKDFLTQFITQQGCSPPPNWDGTIRLGAK